MPYQNSDLTNWLARLRVHPPVHSAGLQVFGLFHPHQSALSYLTLDEGLESESVEMTEVSESGSVPTLKLSNRSDSMVFLMAGEEIIGAKQNRVLNVSLMAAPGSELRVPVSCVEEGRWGYTSRKFRRSNSRAHSKLRAKMALKAAQYYRDSGRPLSDQAEIWDEVSEKLCVMHAHSPSGALHQAYADHAEALDEICQSVQLPEDCCGAVFCIAGRIAGTEVFDTPATLSKLWPKLLRSYAIDALEVKNEERADDAYDHEVSVEQIEDWLRYSLEARPEPFESPGIGHDVRLDSEVLGGGSLVVERQPVHTEIFAVVGD